MKTNLKTVGALLAFGLLGIGAQASNLLNENFNEYSDGLLPTGPSQTWTNHSGTGGIAVSGGQLYDGQIYSSDVSTLLTGNPYNPIGQDFFYVSFTVNFQFLPTASGGYYFAHFKDYGTANFRARMFALTNGAAAGKFRLGIASAAGSAAVTNTTDLSIGTTYTVVARYFNPTNTFSSPASTLWINPVKESSSSITATDATTPIAISMYAFRQPGSTTSGINASAATMAIDNLLVGTTFADVVSGSVNPPTIVVQPQDVTVFAGSSAGFTNLAAGDPTLAYQWYSVTNNVTNAIPGATGLTLTLTGVATNQTGYIFAVVTNSAGTNATRLAQFTVSPQPVPPIIDTNIFPAGSTNIVGDTVTFSVVAHGLPAPAYQWRVINGSVTNPVAGSNISGTNSATLTISSVTSGQAGTYFVNITNSSSVGYMVTNSALAVLKVNPPPAVNIVTLRGMVDGTYAPTNTTALYTATGIVTTWTNMSSGGCSFYMQDSTAGINVFWSGAPGSNLPPAGARVQVTAPLSSFNNLLELAPYYTNSLHSLVVLSTGNPLPAPQPLPFDPNVANNLATMKALESSYFVASNVMLNLSTATFVSGANDTITNNATHVKAFTNSVLTVNFTNTAGQTFVLYINGYTDIPKQTKSTGPVTIYGVLGNYKNTFEFTPSRFADIVSYVNFTNELSNVVRYGDLLTNTYTESFLEPGETLTTSVSIGDPEGGTVTLTPVTAGLPASAHWDGITSGLNATATFHFTPASGDASSNYVVALAESSTKGTVGTNYWNVYVPTPVEQKIAITEILANPTTNSSAPNFNPLHRSTDTLGISTNDQYVEIANQSSTSVQLFGVIDAGTPSAPLEDFSGTGPTLPAADAIVVFGGNYTESPNLPVYNEPASSGSLRLPTSGTGLIVLRNTDLHIIDRVVYNASSLSTNGSLSRFPTINSAFVPQAYISTNQTTAGRQYDGRPWDAPTQVPKGVSNIAVSSGNHQVTLSFTANTSQASTLWSAADLTAPFQVIFGQQFPTTSGVFSITNPPSGPSHQFYYITTQTNSLAP
jgi:hypothetical protein